MRPESYESRIARISEIGADAIKTKKASAERDPNLHFATAMRARLMLTLALAARGAPPGPPERWLLVLDDDFAAFNASRWTKGWTWCDGHGRLRPRREKTKEYDMCYFGDENAWVEGGGLVLENRHEGHGKWNYTSGVVSTGRSFSALYGYFEARILAAPNGGAPGACPAFWLCGCGARAASPFFPTPLGALATPHLAPPEPMRPRRSGGTCGDTCPVERWRGSLFARPRRSRSICRACTSVSSPTALAAIRRTSSCSDFHWVPPAAGPGPLVSADIATVDAAAAAAAVTSGSSRSCCSAAWRRISSL